MVFGSNLRVKCIFGQLSLSIFVFFVIKRLMVVLQSIGSFLKIACFFLVVIFVSNEGLGQELEAAAFIQDSVSTTTKVKKKSLFKIIWGDQLRNSVTAMPIGLHTDFEKHSSKTRSTINGLHEALYFAGNYKCIELAFFQNSFADLTVAVFYKRAWNFTKRLSMNVGGGLMYGYDGRLQYTTGIPFRDTWLIKGDVNPVAGIELDYRFYRRWSVHTSIAPRIIIYGFRFLL